MAFHWAVTLCLATCVGGCQLIGYDGYTLPDTSLDGGFDVLDTGTPGQTSLDGEASGDGAASPADAGRDGALQCSAEVNACGGCSTLAMAPNARCGACGLGRLACDGTDTLVCSGGDEQPKASDGALLLDDFEDGDSIPKAGWGANGYWFAYSDHTAGHLDPADGSRITPAYDGAAGTQRSAHISGGGFTDYGAGLILWPNEAHCTFDVSNQRGIGFWVKGSATMQLSISTVRTLEKQYCGTSCNDFHSKSFVLSDTWTHYTLPWTSLKQAGWGTPAVFEPKEVLYFQFSFDRDVDFELYLDELGFF